MRFCQWCLTDQQNTSTIPLTLDETPELVYVDSVICGDCRGVLVGSLIVAQFIARSTKNPDYKRGGDHEKKPT